MSTASALNQCYFSSPKYFFLVLLGIYNVTHITGLVYCPFLGPKSVVVGPGILNPLLWVEVTTVLGVFCFTLYTDYLLPGCLLVTLTKVAV